MSANRPPRVLRSHHWSLPLLIAAVLVFGLTRGAAGQVGPAGDVVIAWHVTIAPTWFDPSTAPPQITPFGMLYALHDALVRPLPGQKVGTSLAESWKESPDGLVYEFKLRRGVKFHNGDPVTTEDVKFSYDRYKGAGAKELQTRIRQVEIVDAATVRFHLKEPWPDFMTFYGTTATGAGIVVPKKYLTQVGDEGFRKHPIGAGPSKFVSHSPGVEVVLEANTAYWRRVPNVKRLTFKSVPETTTRVAMLKKGEADIAYALDGEDAENVRRDPRLTLVPSKHASIYWIEFADQWDPKSPWHDKRLRLAVNHALNRKAINEAACLGYCPPAGVIVPRVMDFALQVAPPAHDPHKAKQLLAEAGYPAGLDAGDFTPIPDGRAGNLLRAMARKEATRVVPRRSRELRERR
jgi:peptide/nickel transport system substrate-binding protein